MKMKLDDFIFYNKWVSYIGIGFLGPLVAGLGQWVNEGTWPPSINWVAILAGCGIGMFTQNLSFLSSANSERKNQKKLQENSEKPITNP